MEILIQNITKMFQKMILKGLALCLVQVLLLVLYLKEVKSILIVGQSNDKCSIEYCYQKKNLKICDMKTLSNID